MKKDEDLDFSVDEYGRVIISNTTLLEAISGAISIEDFDLKDGACENNGACSNSSCNN